MATRTNELAAAMQEDEAARVAANAGFRDFKRNPATREMLNRLGLQGYLEIADSWRSLRHLVVDLNDNKKRGCVVDRARKLDGVASSGERVLLHALLYAMDFAWLADELTEGNAWRRMGNVSGPHQRAVVACIQGAWA